MEDSIDRLFAYVENSRRCPSIINETMSDKDKEDVFRSSSDYYAVKQKMLGNYKRRIRKDAANDAIRIGDYLTYNELCAELDLTNEILEGIRDAFGEAAYTMMHRHYVDGVPYSDIASEENKSEIAILKRRKKYLKEVL